MHSGAILVDRNHKHRVGEAESECRACQSLGAGRLSPLADTDREHSFGHGEYVTAF
jgi:hypothetical protein